MLIAWFSGIRCSILILNTLSVSQAFDSIEVLVVTSIMAGAWAKFLGQDVGT